MMSEYDVRHGNVSTIDCIRFADEEINYAIIANTLNISDNGIRKRVELRDRDYDIDEGIGYVVISDIEHAEHLISALNKAIELGWLK